MQCPSCETVVSQPSRFCPSCGAVLSGSSPGTGASLSADALIGTTLGGKYKIIRLIGEGGMGAVYEGEQPLGSAKRKVAVKTLHPRLSQDPKIQARFEREVGTIAELEHPNTIQLYDFGSTPEGTLYIVMELLHGGSLADRLAAEGAMAPERAVHVIEQTCGSLEEAHARGIVHRDLKPDNIVLVERAGQKDFVKVLDFGIAKRSAEPSGEEQKLTQQGMVLGTPPYMSPEQFSGGAIDARSDIYSLGVVAYELLTGKLPFKANTTWEWAAQHLTQPPVPIESLAEGARVPHATREAIRRALSKSPDDRMQTARAFADAFAGRSGPVVTDAPEASPDTTAFAAPLDAALAEPSARTPPPHTAHTAIPFPAAGANVDPSAPPRRKGARLLGVAAVVGIGSVAAIVFALNGGGKRAPSDGALLQGAPSPAPDTSLSPEDAAPADMAATRPDAPDVPPLLSDGLSPHPSSRASAAPSASPRPASLAAPSTSAARSAGSAEERPAPHPSAAPLPPLRDEIPECQKARALRAMGRRREARHWAMLCEDKGGSP